MELASGGICHTSSQAFLMKHFGGPCQVSSLWKEQSLLCEHLRLSSVRIHVSEVSLWANFW